MLSLERVHNSLSKEVLQAFVWERFEFIEKLGLSRISLINIDIADIVIWVRYVVGLIESYLQKNFKSIFLSSYGPKGGFVYTLWSVGHLESDHDHNLISSSPYYYEGL